MPTFLNRLIPREPGYPLEVGIVAGELGQTFGMQDRHDQRVIAEDPSRNRRNRDLAIPNAEGVAEPSPGSPKAHPGSLGRKRRKLVSNRLGRTLMMTSA